MLRRSQRGRAQGDRWLVSLPGEGAHTLLRVATIFGTRPEATKMAPVILALRGNPHTEVIVLSSGQHRELLPQALGVFGLRADRDLAAMQPGQSIGGMTSRILHGCEAALAEVRPDVVLVHGDTTTTLAAALAAFYAKIPVGHVEAGLRTGDRYSPFPEEMNRLLADRICDLHFAPTELSAANLRREGIDPAGIVVTGNTAIDGLLAVAGPRRRRPPGEPRLVLIEAHRRENLGEPMHRIACAVRELARAVPGLELVWSLHPNPAVTRPVRSVLEAETGVRLIPPPDYVGWARLMAEADLILTDSGGIQEEAPALGVPVLILRESTERPEVVACGAGRLVGTEVPAVVAAARELLSEAGVYRAMAEAGSPFGDGRASRRIVDALLQRFAGGATLPAAFSTVAPHPVD